MSRRESSPSVVVAFVVLGLFAALGGLLLALVVCSGARA